MVSLQSPEKIKKRLESLRAQIDEAERDARWQSPTGMPQGPAYREAIIRANELEYILMEEKNESEPGA